MGASRTTAPCRDGLGALTEWYLRWCRTEPPPERSNRPRNLVARCSTRYPRSGGMAPRYIDLPGEVAASARATRRRGQRLNVTAYPTKAASTTSLMKWAPLATRDRAHPSARPYQTLEVSGNNLASIAAAAKATAASLLGSPSSAVENGPCSQGRHT